VHLGQLRGLAQSEPHPPEATSRAEAKETEEEAMMYNQAVEKGRWKGQHG